ncbi:sialate O-acetylesterase [uncultured Bacteroides sp.]|uniref:sialate O-acetylesterase n=1 Tax=uncultured Bacteroides sp. TaxID=162156 RepID=UPI002AAA76FD|nr:sialate O-acetylesterase [uncultured Bacteroides sp.]
MKIRIIVFFLVLFVFTCLRAEISVSSIIGDNMVLQRNTEVKLWGNAKPNQKLNIFTSWNNFLVSCVCDEKGQWQVKVRTTEAGGPYSIKIYSQKEEKEIDNISLGEVWLCSGQSNMEMPIMGFNDQPIYNMNDVLIDADNNQIRLFTVGKNSSGSLQSTCLGKWDIANSQTVNRFSAIGYFFAKQLQQKLKVPVGVICSSWGGSNIESWMSKEAIQKFPITLTRAQKLTLDQQRPMHLYNGMIFPIINYRIKGAIWYQGEANIGNYKEYADLMNELVSSWRNDFKEKFPFYFVQIAPYSYDSSMGISSVLLRNEQLKASLVIPNAGMVSTIDIGEENIIHPAEKLIVSKRLSYWALSEIYGVNGVAYKTPYFKNSIVKDSTVLISFENASGGLTSFGKKLDNFEVAGDNMIFYPAYAIIKSEQVQVSSSLVKKPVAVRYAFHNFPQGKGFLYNLAGLPVPSFRTDEWEK